MAKPRLEFFFDFASTYSYLASTQLDAMAERAGAEILWRPMVLGAVFQGAGNDMPAKVAAKAPTCCAISSVGRSTTGALQDVEPLALSDHRGRAADSRRGRVGQGPGVRQGRVPGDVGRGPQHQRRGRVLSKLLAEVGLDPAAALARSKSPEIKERLRTNTDLALSRGAFGAPAMFVGEELFWGNDRLHFVEDALKRAGA
ncbi:MAG: DsbA family protein [Polyangiaceae bacterium]|nr:DsbA family protein [Polyangiaceae bacterium]